jgi:cytochrome c peroxidase
VLRNSYEPAHDMSDAFGQCAACHKNREQFVSGRIPSSVKDQAHEKHLNRVTLYLYFSEHFKSRWLIIVAHAISSLVRIFPVAESTPVGTSA